ncbi:S-methyl thiohydantoin desulfurase domain-containing protein [Streptomyces sp. BE133]|uniref:S-methyl thiohydantoin desulfurase domain-containing protein n=1 Tax=Streptomyces sp. BE133 TaxID=3002523 RepID=UPI002E76EFEC|nr:DUF917 family protein [Streptomyces sp. BE133]
MRRPGHFDVANAVGAAIGCAAEAGLPLVDGDAMGRAFPEAQMVLPGLIGVANTPMALSHDKGNGIIVDAVSHHAAERIARAVCVELGCQISSADTVMRGTGSPTVSSPPR